MNLIILVMNIDFLLVCFPAQSCFTFAQLPLASQYGLQGIVAVGEIDTYLVLILTGCKHRLSV